MTNRVFPFLTLCVLVIAGCSSVRFDEVILMPPPDVYGDGMLDPLPEADPITLIPYGGILYATDRMPASPGDEENYYSNDRGGVVRFGVAHVSLHESAIDDWEIFRQLSLSKNRKDKYRLRVSGVEEFGLLEDTLPGFKVAEDYDKAALDGEEEFAAAVNAQLARSKRKHIYIYVHGYKTVFENPALVATELWHFMGYDGVMVAYAWPSTPSKWAYIRDSDTSVGFARHFRKFLEYLGESTAAEEIHVVAFSSGTRMVISAFEQLALMNHQKSRQQMRAKLRVGNLILVGSDLDRDVFGNSLKDGLLDVPRHTSVYVSDKDKALGFSRWLTRRERLGQLIKEDEMTPGARRLLSEHKSHISVIDVSEVEGAKIGNGHGYFRDSPLVSSDILMTLMYDFTPEERGLEFKASMPVYEFPPDYLSHLWAAIAEVNPDFRRAYRARRAPLAP